MGTIKSALLVPGWKADILTGWMPWMLLELERRNVSTRFCQLPHRSAPLCLTAQRKLEKWAKTAEHPRLLICHSFGAKVALKALSKTNFYFDIVVLVAPLYRWPFGEWFRLWPDYVDFENLRKNCGRLLILHSKDDKLVPIANGVKLALKCRDHGINIAFHPFDERGHFAPGDGCFEIPELLEILDQLEPQNKTVLVP